MEAEYIIKLSANLYMFAKQNCLKPISIYLGGHTNDLQYCTVELQKQKLIITLMDTDKKENKFSSYIRKFRMEQLQSHI